MRKIILNILLIFLTAFLTFFLTSGVGENLYISPEIPGIIYYDRTTGNAIIEKHLVRLNFLLDHRDFIFLQEPDGDIHLIPRRDIKKELENISVKQRGKFYEFSVFFYKLRGIMNRYRTLFFSLIGI